MDPVSILSVISASSTIVLRIATIVHSLNKVCERYHDAGVTVGLLISELTAVKAAVIQIEDWAEYNFTDRFVPTDLRTAFRESLEGCGFAVQALGDEVEDVLSGMLSKEPGFRARMRYVWNESIIREHQQRLHTQVNALQLLIQAVQMSLPGQAAVLCKPENHQIFEKVRDNTTSLCTRARSFRAGSDFAPSRTASAIGSTVFNMDETMQNSSSYRVNGARIREKHKEREKQNHVANHSNSGLSSNVSLGDYRQKNLEARPSASAIFKEEQLPIIIRPSRRKTLLYEKSRVSEPTGKIGLRGCLALRASGSSLQGFGQPSEAKLSVWTALRYYTGLLPFADRRKYVSPAGLEKLFLASRRSPRRYENDLHLSIDFSSQIGQTAPPIVRAAQTGSLQEIEELLDRGADIEEAHTGSGRTALAVAAHCGNKGNKDIVQLLLQYRARIDVVDSSSRTPLHLSASRGHYRVVEYLLQEHADVDAVCLEKKTPLRLALDYGYNEVVALLLRKGAKVNTRDWQQLTALHAAAKDGDDTMVNLLVTHGADVEAKDGSFMTAIHYAAEGGYYTIVETLLNRKANIECLGRASMTPLACAASSGSTEVVKLLLQRKAPVRHRCEGNMTPLIGLATMGMQR